MIKDFEVFDHQRDISDITLELNNYIKAFSPKIEIQLLTSDSEFIQGDSRLAGCGPKTKFTACINLSIVYEPTNITDFEALISNIPNWPLQDTRVGRSWWDEDQHLYISKEYCLTPDWRPLNYFSIATRTKTPDHNTTKGRLNPNKKYQIILDISLEATASTKYGLKQALKREILNKVDEINHLDRKLNNDLSVWDKLGLFNNKRV